MSAKTNAPTRGFWQTAENFDAVFEPWLVIASATIAKIENADEQIFHSLPAVLRLNKKAIKSILMAQNNVHHKLTSFNIS